MKQFVIAIDQLLNTVVWDSLGGFGKADETLSARAWRLQASSSNWKYFRVVLDKIFAIFNDKDHCYNSWLSEKNRKQLPEEYKD